MATQANGVLSTGPDRSIQVVNLTTQQVLDFGPDLISFTAPPVIERYTRNTISGGGLRKMRTRTQGWDGTFVYGRVNGDLEKFQIAKAQAQKAGGKEDLFDIVVTTLNAYDDSTDVFRYTQATLNMTNPGDWTAASGAGIEISFTFEAMECYDESP